jgi:serine/threonine protein kinase
VEPFLDSGRIRIDRIIGSGSFGMVFEAWDEERQQPVALKRLTRVGPEGLFRFKQEFRLLADMNHPNLVNLHELYAEGGIYSFTMELVDGMPFTAWVRGEAPAGIGAPTVLSSPVDFGPAPGPEPTLKGLFLDTWDSDPEAPGGAAPARGHSPLQSPGRLRMALAQLVKGIQALHSSGKLHLDLKSNNVLITNEGRVVVLDFGLARELDVGPGRLGGHQMLDRLGGHQTLDHPGGHPAPEHPAGHLAAGPAAQPPLFGTPTHLAPEIVQGGPATEASDWYSVGVMLYECLTGGLPFPGSALEVIQAKAWQDAPSPLAACPGLPADLAALCSALLHRNPARRADGRSILAALGSAPPVQEPRRAARALLGRERELETLQLALAGIRGGGFRTVLLKGASGMGKTFLLNRFLREAAQKPPRAIALVGRCFEQESVPFKGMDNLVDGLSELLRQMAPEEAEALLPTHVRPLVRLFPVLNLVPAIARAAGATSPAEAAPEGIEAQDVLRRQAFGALRELVARLSRQRPVILALDDFQWADLDTVSLLLELIRPPQPASLMLIVSYRSEEAERAKPLATLLDTLWQSQNPRVTVELEALAPEVSLALASALVPDPAQASAIAQEAQGNPWLIHELALQTGRPLASGHRPGNLNRLVVSRAEALPASARDVLHLLAVAGYPLAWDLVRRAAKAHTWEVDPVSLLRQHHLARLRGTPWHRVLEIYHDRVREALVGSLAPATLRDCHLRLAKALEASPQSDTQALANHYLAAGETVLAAEYSAQAAQQSEAAMAFDHAASLYLKSVALRGPLDPQLPQLRIRLANALAMAGRSGEAAREYLAAAAEAAPPEALHLRRRAAEEFFRSGHVAEGQRIGGQVLAALGLRVPPNRLRSMVSMIYHRCRLRLRGLGSVERSEQDVPARLLERLDVLWSMAMGLGPFDIVRAADFQTRHLLLALEAGEPIRLVRGLAHETALRATVGTSTVRFTQRLQAMTLDLAERIGRPEALARAQLATSIAATAFGRWHVALEWADKATETLRQGCAGMAYELNLAQFFSLRNAMLLGHFPEVQHRYPGLLQEARHQGDLLMATNLLVVVGSMLRLAEDDPALAHHCLDQAMSGWQQKGYLLPHMDCLAARVNVLLYEGRSQEALEDVSGQWPELKKSMLLGAQALRVTARELQARVLLATGRDSRARAWIRAMAREDCDYSQALALKNEAILEARAGHPQGHDLLFKAEMALRASQLNLHAECVCRVRGAHLGGNQGNALICQADQWMESRGILNPARMARMLAPGLG